MSDRERQRNRIVRRVHETSTELSALTAAAGLSTLAYLLDMTVMEAERLLREPGEN